MRIDHSAKDLDYHTFRDRAEAALALAEKFKDRTFDDPLVLAIPRGGVVTGSVLAKELKAELDVVLVRKLRAPSQPELAVGAIGENGEVYLNHDGKNVPGLSDEYIEQEKQRESEVIVKRKKVYRAIRPQAPVAGRSVVVTDDGIATGSTIIAALQIVRSKKPKELLVAVPIAPIDRLEIIKGYCNEVVCLLMPHLFLAVGQAYKDFTAVDDKEVVEILKSTLPTRSRHKHQAVG